MTGFHARPLTRPTPLRGSNGVAFGPDGRLYVAQFLAGEISAVDLATGDVEVVVPAGGPVQAPDDLAFGTDGSMYLTDLVPGRVWRRHPDGTFTLVTDRVRLPNGITCIGDRLFVNEMIPGGRLLELGDGEPKVLAGELAMGNAMQLGPDGALYYPHMLTGEVFRIPPDGGTPELVATDVHEPVAVRFDLGGVLQVLSRGAAGIVTRIDLLGTGDRTLLTSGLTGLDNAAFDTENRMFVSSYAAGGITELHPDGRTREITPRGFAGPYGVTVDLGGTVHVADHYRITEPHDGDVTTTELLTFAHGIAADGDLLHLTAQYGQVRTYDRATREVRTRAEGLDQPLGIAVRADGTLLVAESGAGRVLAIDAEDTVSVLADGFGRPAGVAVDGEGPCYFSDEERGAVYRLDGETTTVLADDLGAPQGIAVVDGCLYVAETATGKLAAVDLATGAVRTAADLPASPGRTGELPALHAHGLPGVPRPFTGLATAPGNSLYAAAGGTVLHLTPAAAS
ncbi:PQQ-binding-like beta-propeller repeat protein [Amycolatopsis sp.]|uniref:Vgb family protein n=1 Tax=Amycolatopsis sp. TaxID=37632 RepID=UPI002D7E4817|nr:PQQ-binding-like beta-propeller repeat protein [Amycolatopsis sp.]HET6709839.1 PQQ-binding-like beta-propeller repeat protein [Amycolatopsis sp.]